MTTKKETKKLADAKKIFKLLFTRIEFKKIEKNS